MADRYRSGGIGYGEVKVRLAEHISNRFAEARERRPTLVADPERIAEVRRAAAERARRRGPGRPRPGPAGLRGGLSRPGRRPGRHSSRPWTWAGG